jgi:hypothetical protein
MDYDPIPEFDSYFEELQRFQKEKHLEDYSILEVILIYCEEHNYDPEEFGLYLKKERRFVETFKEDLLYHNQAKFDQEKIPNSEWIAVV